jgi:fatty acid kinase fatty acid binding subunit
MTFKKIRFVTDSTCDLPPDLIQQYGIGLIPTYVNYNNRSYADDGQDLVREAFYRDLPTLNPFPTTATPPPGIAEDIINRTFEGADHLFLISVASKLSGVYNVMRLGASKLPQDRVTLIDSRSVTMGLGFQVLMGIETADATGDVDQVKSVIESVRERARVYAALETLEFLRRGGRVGWAAAGIGALLQIKPVLDVYDGEVRSGNRVRTFSRAVDELVRLAHAQTPLERFAILYAGDHDRAVRLRERLADIAPPDTLIVSITPTIGTHVGNGGLGVATVCRSN